MEGMLGVDVRKCMGCYACEIACKEAHAGPAHRGSWVKVVRADASRSEAKEKGHYLPLVCVHCLSPACVEACPEEALTQRRDGIVILDSSSCIGCRVCIEACPHEAIFFDDEEGVAFKCNLCAERIDAELWPSCVQHCFAQVFSFEPGD